MHTDKPLVLLVEDNPGDANLVEEAFAEARLECHLSIVTNGAEAIDFIDRLDSGLSADCPNLILLDLNIPKGSGVAVLERVRVSPKCGTAKVLIISSSDSPTDRKRVMDLGADGYFTKPSSLDQFMELGPRVQGMLRDWKRSPPAATI